MPDTIEYPHLREDPSLTLKEYRKHFDKPRSIVTCDTRELRFTDKTIEWPAQDGPKRKTEAPLTRTLTEGMSDWLKVPPKFVERQDADFRAVILNGLAARMQGDIAFSIDGDGDVVEIFDPQTNHLDVRLLLDLAEKIMGSDALIAEGINTPGLFQIDLTVPAHSKTAIGGDKPKGKSVGDITRGGLRFGVKRSLNQFHAPWTANFLYRLACTNGMEVPSFTKVDARGSSIDEIMAQLEAQANILFADLDEQITRFYALREAKLDHDQSDTILRRTIRENGIPIRGENLATAQDMILTVADPTMFDIVNIITNHANNPNISHKHAQRRNLERGGGELVNEHHVTRCPQCLTKVSH